ncbi:MAG TPA: alpha/beta hydrolase-fold protein [Chloroflexota bacterium]|nr:alpha/beta hydrolase-fold protein [Chloroflexota bacterium]
MSLAALAGWTNLRVEVLTAGPVAVVISASGPGLEAQTAVPVPLVPSVTDEVPYPAPALNRERLDAAVTAVLRGAAPIQHGEWREVRFFSRTLDREMAYYAWLPPGYAASEAEDPGASERTYPTLYLLHGLGDPDSYGKDQWRKYGIAETMDELLALGLVQPMLIILPEGEQGYWINHADGGPRWADYLVKDVVAHVDLTFRTQPVRERRAVGGMSMGAHGALQLGLNYPDVFAIVGAHAPTLRAFEQSPPYFGDFTWFSRYDPISLVQATSAARRLATWIDVGHLDPWRAGVERLRQALMAQGAPLEYIVLEGEHQTWYWGTYLPEYLRYYARAFSAPGSTADGAPRVTTASAADDQPHGDAVGSRGQPRDGTRPS